MNPTPAIRAAVIGVFALSMSTIPVAHAQDLTNTLGIHGLPAPLAPAAKSTSIPTTITPLTSCAGTQSADRTTWGCTFDEEFNGTSLNRSIWSPQVNFPTGDQNTHSCYMDDPRTISVNNGALHLSMVKIPSTNSIPCGSLSAIPTTYISGQVSTYHTFGQEYGRFEARLRNVSTSASGLQEDYWLWPDDRYGTTVPVDSSVPGNGEIDVVELFSVYPHFAVPYLHYTVTDNTGAQPGINTANCPAERGVWNTYDLVWNAQYLAIYVNGTLCLANTSQNKAFNKPYITLFSMAMGSGTDAFSSAAPIPATLDVDYARAWQYRN